MIDSESIYHKIGMMTQKAAAEYLGVSIKVFVQLVKDGEIGYKKVGKSKRYTRGELDRWMSNPDYHIRYTNEGKSGTRVSLSSTTGKEYSFAKRLAARQEKKLRDAV